MKKQRLRYRKQRFPAVGTRCADHVTPLYPPQVGTNFADRWRPLCRYSSLADYGHGVFIYWVMGRQSAMSTHNKLVLYKQILKPVWTYGIQLWGCTKPSNIAIIQRFQNRVLRNVVG